MRALILVVLLLPSVAQAKSGIFYSGESFYKSCNEQPSFATAYVAGVFDAMEVAGLYGAKTFSCAPPSVTTRQARDVACRYHADNPQKRHLGAALLVLESLQRAWPCH